MLHCTQPCHLLHSDCIQPFLLVQAIPGPYCAVLQGAPPTYFIVAGLVFTPATVPYLRSEYGKEYDYDAPVSGRHK